MARTSEHTRLTWYEIQQRYPHQWIGITNITTEADDDATVGTAEVVYTDRDRVEFENIQFDTNGNIRAVYTTPDTGVSFPDDDESCDRDLIIEDSEGHLHILCTSA